MATAVALAWGLVGGVQEARAACTVSGLTATCSAATVSTFTSNVNNLIVNVDNGATVYSSLGNDMTLGGNNITFNNNGGTIGPTMLASLVEFTSAVVMGNSNNSTVRVNNSGIVRAIGDNQSGSMPDLTGMAFEIKNGANGSVTFTNNNTIDSAPLITANGLAAADIPAIVIYNPLNAAAGAGPRVTFLNAPTAMITGRVAFQGSSQGNTFINGGTLSGSLSMGTGGATANTFIAVTGSVVTAGGGSAATRGVTGKANISFAAAGTVDGGLNGAVSGFNTLRLQNKADVADTGIGSAGSGSISSATYLNFPNLRVISGTWTILGPLLRGYSTTTVQLTGGIASVNDSQVFGNAIVVSSGGELRSLDPSVNLANTVTVGPNGLKVSGSSQLTLSGQLTGGGMLTKSGSSTLVLSNASNDYTGGTTLAGGTLSLSNAQAIGYFGLSVTDASTLQLTAPMELENNITLSSALSVNGGSSTVTLSGDITGTGSLTKLDTGNLILSGTNTFSGGLALGGGTVTLGNASAIGAGDLTVGGDATLATSSAMTLDNALHLNAGLTLAGNNNLTLDGTIDGPGSLTKTGTGSLTLSGVNTYSGGTTLNGGSLVVGSDVALGSGTLSTANDTTLENRGLVTLANNLNVTGNLLLVGNSDLTLDGTIGGTGALTKLGTGTLTLSGSNSLTGNTTINAGTLKVNGSLASASVLVNSGGTLTGSGSLGGAVTVADGGHLAGATGSTLSVNSLAFNANSNFDAGLGTPVSGGGNALVNVSGNLTLDGTLNVSDIGGFGSGVYRLINYTGGLTDNGMLIGTVPGSVPRDDLALQTAQANQINLLVTAPGSTVQFWDGNQLVANGSIGGGSGTWGTGTTNWTDVNGTTNQGWVNRFAVFQGAAGTVTVDGAQTINGMQFVTDGYSLQNGTAGSLNLVNGSQGNATVRVDPNATATIGVALNGSGTLGKYDAGTLVLNAANGYTGGTALNGGKIVVGNNAALGTGVLTAANGTALESNATVSLANNVVLNGGLTVAGSNDLTLAGNISGVGSLTKNGSSTLTLNGTNTYTGGTYVQAGTLKIGGLSALVQGSFYQVNTGATLDLNGHALQTGGISGTGNVALGSQGLTVNTAAGSISEFDGKMDGTGELIKLGDGTLSLNTANSFSGGVSHKGGNINLGNEKGLGSGTLAMDDGTKITLTANGMTIANNLHMTGNNDPIVDTGSNNGTWAGAITGAGFLTKQGIGMLTMTSTGNTYTGATDVAQGTLQAGAANTFSSASAHTVAAGAVLDLAGYNQTLASLNNSGTVKLSSNSGAMPGTVLKVTGAYVGNNGNLGLSTVLGADGSATDKLLLSGASAVASGNTTVHITNAGGLGAQTTGNGIQVIGTENGASLQPGSFTLAGGHVDAGAYEYRLTQTAQGAALQSSTTAPTTPTTPTTAYRAEVPLLSALPAQLRQADMAMLGDLRKRMGDEGTQAMTSSDTGASRRVWGRILRTDPKISQQGTVSPESSGHLTGFQAGLDLYADQSIKAGIYVGQLEGDMSVKGFASGVDRKYVGFNNLRTRYLGVYGTWQDQSGLYADAVLQGADYRSDLRTAGDTAQARTKGSGWLASVEMGKAFAVTSNWQIEPQAQIIYRKLSIDDTALSLATVKNKADDDWTVRLGARLKGNFATGAGVLQPYGRINVYKASNTTDIASFAAQGGTTDIKAKGGYTATEMAAGASLQINPRTSVYGELGKLWANGGDSRVKSGVQASIGVKVQW